MSRISLAVRLVARLQSALPMLGVAALAGYTWWLVESAPGAVHQAGSVAPEGQPDYVMEHARVERFDASGQMISVLQGQSISHFLTGDRVVVEGLRLSAQDPKGQMLQASASEGRYTADSSVVDLVGHAQVTVTPTPAQAARGPVVFDGEALSVNTETRVLRSDKPASLSSAQGVVHGSSLMHDAKVGISQVGGRVVGHMQGPAD